MVTELFWPKGTRKGPGRPLGHSASHTKNLVCQENLYRVANSVSSRTIARSCVDLLNVLEIVTEIIRFFNFVYHLPRE